MTASANAAAIFNSVLLLPEPQHAGVLYSQFQNSGSGMSLYKSSDVGTTWSPLAPPNVGSVFAVAPTTPTRIYSLGSTGNSATGYDPNQLAMSEDGGVTWTAAGWGLRAGCQSFSVDALMPQRLYANCPTETGYRLFVTTTGGQ